MADPVNRHEVAADAPTVAGVRFRPTGRIMWCLPGKLALRNGQWVIVETPRGHECGRVVVSPRQVAAADLGSEPPFPIVRTASDDDLARLLEWKAKEKSALRDCAEQVSRHSLPMKLVESEYTWDGKRLTFFFVAENRVDFRALVRDLANHFHTRIELRQVGARDHAKALGGVGMCGKALCCSSWLTDFNGVSIKMAKDQDLPLNNAKISGVCGRLMCCLAYEHETYLDAHARMPEIGDFVTGPTGPGRVVGHNVPREAVNLLLESGATLLVPVRELLDFKPPAQPERHEPCDKPNCRRKQHHTRSDSPPVDPLDGIYGNA
ncbi:MAG TPA: stage 0 sporulation family protein [Ktedonobacterales bacterium]